MSSKLVAAGIDRGAAVIMRAQCAAVELLEEWLQAEQALFGLLGRQVFDLFDKGGQVKAVGAEAEDIFAFVAEAVMDAARCFVFAADDADAPDDRLSGFDVVIDIPGGEEMAAKTLNASLGIVGGLSVLGTTGIVKPMSEQALLDTIRVEISQRLALGDEVLFMTPGNYGETFMQAHYPDAADHVIKISNYIGDSLDMALEAGAKAICLTGHIGKMVKIAGGIMNTHSRNGDARMEILAANAVLCGADAALAKEILQMKTTDAGIELLEQVHLTEKVMERLVMRIEEYLNRRVKDQIPVGVVLFSNVYGLLGKNAAAEWMLEEPREPGDGSVVSFGTGSEVKE